MTILGQFAAPVAVGITVYILTAVPKLNNIPANVFGYAATFGWLLTELIALEAALASDGGSVLEIGMGHPFILNGQFHLLVVQLWLSFQKCWLSKLG